MTFFRRLRIDARGVASLAWRGDQLVDWVNGGNCWDLDGRFRDARRGWGNPRFDAALADPSGRYAAVYERTGTAALLLRDGEIVRELHRSPYHADAFEYPIALFAREDGRMILAHCPDGYGRIDLDDADTGERLTAGRPREPLDFFHSRLSASPGGTRLCSAGWVWHPWNAVVWFDVAAALADPTALDRLDGSPELSRNVCLAEESSAAWIDEDRLAVGGSDEAEDPDEAALADREHPGPRLRPRGLAVYHLPSRSYTAEVPLPSPPGEMMAVGPRHVVAFHQHPRLLSLATGVVHVWGDLESGARTSSIIWDRRVPPQAWDRAGARFAIATGDAIHVIELDVAALPG